MKRLLATLLTLGLFSLGCTLTDGAAFLALGPLSGNVMLDDVAVQMNGLQDDGVGLAVAAAGDINADGIPALLVGAGKTERGGVASAGAAWAVLGAGNEGAGGLTFENVGEGGAWAGNGDRGWVFWGRS